MSIRRSAVRRVREGRREGPLGCPGAGPTERNRTMRVMVIVKATKNFRSWRPPGREVARRHGRVQRKAREGWHHARRRWPAPEQQGQARTLLERQEDDDRRPIRRDEGGFIAGFWIWQVKSMDEALEWARRCPDPMPGEESSWSFVRCSRPRISAPSTRPELRARDGQLRIEIEKQQRS